MSSNLFYFIAALLLFVYGVPYASASPQCKGGQVEYALQDGTIVDCLTPKHVKYFVSAKDCLQPLGRALHASLLTGKQIMFIITIDAPNDVRHIRPLQGMIIAHNLPLDIYQSVGGQLTRL